MTTALWIACALACAVLVIAEHRRIPRLRAIAKVLASLAFLALGAVGYLDDNVRVAHDYRAGIVAGLALGVIGDVALLGEGKRAFLVGLGAFLLGHLAYVVAMAQLEPPAEWFADARFLSLLPLAAASVTLVMLWPRLGSMRVPVIAYVLVIVAMVIGAFAVRYALDQPWRLYAPDFGQLPRDNRDRLVVGAVLFFVSDVAVARDKFVASSFRNKAWGLPAYYAGQLLIASTLLT
ncbi:MAG: lysoplasmalogenase [Acidobacteriota bacterium]